MWVSRYRSTWVFRNNHLAIVAFCHPKHGWQVRCTLWGMKKIDIDIPHHLSPPQAQKLIMAAAKNRLKQILDSLE